MTARPKFVSNIVVHLEKISLSEQSGWRTRSQSRINELIVTFGTGRFGLGIVSAVQLLGIQDVDEKNFIDDGYSSVEALLTIKQRCWCDTDKNMNLGSLEKLVNEVAKSLPRAGVLFPVHMDDEQLVDIFSVGLPVKVVRFPDDTDRDTRRDWNVGKHDEEATSVRWSSIGLKCRSAMCAYKRTKDWTTARKYLVKSFNFSETTIGRWCRASAGLSELVLERLETPALEKAPAMAVFDNPYLMGTGAKTRDKLGDIYALRALENLSEKPTMGVEYFLLTMCATMKIIELWDKLNIKRYGIVCEQSPAYKRLIDHLLSEAGLKTVAQTIASGVPLNGTGPENPGVMECYLITEEFKRCKAGNLPPPDQIPTQEEVIKAVAAKKAAEQQAAKEAKEAAAKEAKEALDAEMRADQENMSMSSRFSTQPGAAASCISADARAGGPVDHQEPPDVVEAKRRGMIWQGEMRKFSRFEMIEELIAAITRPIQTVSRVAVVIAAPTSNWSVIKTYMEHAALVVEAYQKGTGDPAGDGQQKVRVLILLGPRLDMMAKVIEKSEKLFPTMHTWTSTIVRCERQTLYHKPSYVAVIASRTEVESLPNQVQLRRPGQERFTTECINARCDDPKCPLRSKEGQQKFDISKDHPTDLAEIDDADCTKCMIEQARMELDDEVGATGATTTQAPQQGHLWPFAFSIGTWDTVLRTFLQAEKAQVLAVFSPSAHPGVWIAAREMNLDVFSLTQRQHPHNEAHGMELGQTLRFEVLAPASQLPNETPPQERSTIMAAIEEKPGLMAHDVLCGSAWHDGVNNGQHGKEFDALCARLVQGQLTESGLALTAVSSSTGRGLAANRGLSEGEHISASAVYFNCEQSLDEFLGRPGHDRYRDRIVLLPLTNGMVWGVLIGAVQFVNHYNGSKKSPNVKLHFESAKGFNEGALSLVVNTRNGAGIGKQSTLLLDYGNKFLMSGADAPSPRTDGYKGALDLLFDNQKCALPSETEQHRLDADALVVEENLVIDAKKRMREMEEAEAAAGELAKKRKLDAVELGKVLMGNIK